MIEEWASSEALDIRDIRAQGDLVVILAVGDKRPASLPELAANLERVAKRPLTINLQVVPAYELYEPQLERGE